MLTLRVEGSLGDDIRETLIPEMCQTAWRTKCRVEMKANDLTIWAMPSDGVLELQAAYDRVVQRVGTQGCNTTYVATHIA